MEDLEEAVAWGATSIAVIVGLIVTHDYSCLSLLLLPFVISWRK